MRSFPLVMALSGATLLGAACSESFPRELGHAPPPTGGLLSRPSNTTCIAKANPVGRVKLEPAFEGFYKPVAMVDRPDLGLLYVLEMPGRVKVVDRRTGSVTTALDLVGKGAGTDAEQGVLGLAIDADAKHAFAVVERDKDATTREDLPVRGELVRFAFTDASAKVLDPASETVILRVDRPTTWHYPGTVEFGPDGLLYLGIGDGGAYLIEDFAQKHPDTLLGTIVRLDLAKGTTPEVFARGFRNPWRFTFDRQTGDVWAGDVGELSWEEVDKVEQGKHYGWPVLEADACFRPRVGCDPKPYAPPVFAYPHTEGGSITGGYVYRGKAMPDLFGRYIFGDFVVGRIWALDTSTGAAKTDLLNPGGAKPAISSFGQDADGELYVLDWQSGRILKLVPGDAESRPVLPQRLSETGCVDPADPTKLAAGLVPYGVSVELWSDGADKKRAFALPDGATLHVEDDGDLSVPEGSVLVKEFAVAGRRVETRLLLHHPGGDWTGATYEWNDEGTEAFLLDGAKEKVLSSGQTWAFPSPAQCFVCHRKATKTALGLETLQLNHDFTYGADDRENQLTKLSALGFLDRPVDPMAMPALPALTSSAPVEDRARAYLHANCSMCHRADSGNVAPMDFRFGLSRASIKGCSPSVFAGRTDVQVLAPGTPERSAIYLRMTNRDGYQMPPLATKAVDPVASRVVEEWIRGLERCD